MEISNFAAQIQHFEMHRQLKDVPKQAAEHQDWIAGMVDSHFKRTRQQDNDYRDYDPLFRRILRWASGQATVATFQIKPGERHLDRIDVEYGRRYLYRIHQQGQVIDVLDTFQGKSGGVRMECWHLDLANPEVSFYQCIV